MRRMVKEIISGTVNAADVRALSRFFAECRRGEHEDKLNSRERQLSTAGNHPHIVIRATSSLESVIRENERRAEEYWRKIGLL